MASHAEIDDVPVSGGGIRLGQFLQLAGLFDTGGEAKAAILAGDVRVNDEVDTRRGRQLATGDLVAANGRQARVSE